MSVEKMNEKINSFNPSASPEKVTQAWNEHLACLSFPDLQKWFVKWGSVLGYKCCCYMNECLYHNVTPSWVDVDGSDVVKINEPEGPVKVVKPRWMQE